LITATQSCSDNPGQPVLEKVEVGTIVENASANPPVPVERNRGCWSDPTLFGTCNQWRELCTATGTTSIGPKSYTYARVASSGYARANEIMVRRASVSIEFC
jgi:hypothetical protein